MDAEYPMAAVRKDDLDVLVAACARYLPDDPEDIDPGIRMALSRLDDARRAGREAAGPGPGPLPGGVFGRIELPGWRNHTGWVTDETRFGIQMAVVRDRAGTVLAEVAVGPGCQLVRLAPPLPVTVPQAALPPGAGRGDGRDDDEDLDDDTDDDDGFGEAPF